MSFILELEFPPPPFVMEMLIGTAPATVRGQPRDVERRLLAAVGPKGDDGDIATGNIDGGTFN